MNETKYIVAIKPHDKPHTEQADTTSKQTEMETQRANGERWTR